MKALTGALAAALAVMCSASLSAQWPKHPTPDVPRLADGTVDPNAPAPRTADGKIDFSGIWQGGFGGGGGRGRGAGPAAGAPAPPPPTGERDAPFPAGFGSVGGRGAAIPYTPWAAELLKQRMANEMRDNPDAHCLPLNHIQLHTHPQPNQIVQSKNLLVMMYEANYGLRLIHLDGRPAPNNDPTPWWYGYSRGWWEGDTLVVETTHFRDGGWLDVNGSPLTDQGKLTERFTRPSFGRLQIDVTVEDPKAYTKPFTVRVSQRIMVDEELIEFICNENEKSSDHYVERKNP